MPKTEKTYTLGKMMQLIDLNEDMTNFKLHFSANTKDKTEFEALVIDQTTLDNNPELEYKKVPGFISGSIEADKNIYQNYYLILRSDSPCQCVVTIEKEEISPNVLNDSVDNNDNEIKENFFVDNDKWKTFLPIVVVVFILICILIWIYFRKSISVLNTNSLASDFPIDKKNLIDSINKL
jgi:hypothetical protein